MRYFIDIEENEKFLFEIVQGNNSKISHHQNDEGAKTHVVSLKRHGDGKIPKERKKEYPFRMDLPSKWAFNIVT